MVTSDIPAAYALEPASPNPFNPETVIRYSLPAESRVNLKVYNLLGQVVATLVEGIQPAGYQSVTWEGGGLSSGIYLCRLDAVSTAGQTFSGVMKMVMVR